MAVLFSNDTCSASATQLTFSEASSGLCSWRHPYLMILEKVNFLFQMLQESIFYIPAHVAGSENCVSRDCVKLQRHA